MVYSQPNSNLGGTLAMTERVKRCGTNVVRATQAEARIPRTGLPRQWARVFLILGICLSAFCVHGPAVAQGLIGPFGFDGDPFAADDQAFDRWGGLDEPLPGEPGAAGGAAMADFDSLMELIQTTIRPDQWEALGGTSTMAPYPAGILVDPSGLVKTSASAPPADAAPTLIGLLPPTDLSENAPAGRWTDPTPVRCVSMRRWMQRLATLASQSAAADAAGDASRRPIVSQEEAEALNMTAGLSRVTLVIATEDDLILAGPVGGFQQVDGWSVDRRSGLPPIRLSAWAVALAAIEAEVPFGCTIDPQPAALADAADVTRQVANGDIPIGMAADRLAETLGRQRVKVFGTGGGHEISWLMVEADRHMKQLALGLEPMPEGTQDLLDVIQSEAGENPPSDVLLRLWFTGQPMAVRHAASDAGDVYQVAGQPLRLSGENERALQSGRRGERVIEPTTEMFVERFNRNWASIRSRYPLYGALESVYHVAGLAQLWNNAGKSSDHQVMRQACTAFAADRAVRLVTPKETETIAVLHRYRRGQQMHHLVLASGGVLVQPAKLLPSQAADYPTLSGYTELAKTRPQDRWWWNAD